MTLALPTNLDYSEIHRIIGNLDIFEEFISKTNREKNYFSDESKIKCVAKVFKYIDKN